MPDVLTNWTPDPDMDAQFTDPVTGETRLYIAWSQYNDDEAVIDLAADLAVGETLANVSTHLLLLQSTTETADTNSDSLLVSPPTIDGTTVRQRMAGLVYQRVYRLSIEFGAAGNHRTVPVNIWVKR